MSEGSVGGIDSLRKTVWSERLSTVFAVCAVSSRAHASALKLVESWPPGDRLGGTAAVRKPDEIGFNPTPK